MSQLLPHIRQAVRQLLRDEFTTGEEAWADDTLDLCIHQALREVSEKAPREVKDTLYTESESRELDIGTPVRLLTFESGGYTDCVASDMGKTVVGGTSGDTGTLLAYDNTNRQWWVRSSDVFGSVEAITITDGTGAGTTTGASTLAFDPDGLLSVDKAEYKVDQWPRKYRNVERWGDTLTLMVNAKPDAGDTVYLYSLRVHELTGSSSSLKPQYENIVQLGAVAHAAVQWLNTIRQQISSALERMTDINSAVDSVSARVTQAVTDLTSGRAYIASKNTEAVSAVDNVAARVTQAVNDLTSGRTFIGQKNAEAITAIDELSGVAGRLTKAVSDIADSRSGIGEKKSEAITAIGNMSARITQSINDLSSGRTTIGDKRSNGISAIDNVSGRLNEAINNLTTGKAKIDDTRTDAESAIDNMSARITEAMNDLDSGRSLINKVNVGGAPEDDYANYARTELANANQYLSQARGYLSEATTADRYGNYAARQLQAANGYLAQARAYLQTDQAAQEYGVYAARELSNANQYLNQAKGYLDVDVVSREQAQLAMRELSAATGYLNQARGYLSVDAPAREYAAYASRELSNAGAYLSEAKGYLALDAPAQEYANYAARELSTATAYLNQSGGYIREMSARLSAIRSISQYERWANNRLVLYQQELRKIGKPRQKRDYPRS